LRLDEGKAGFQRQLVLFLIYRSTNIAALSGREQTALSPSGTACTAEATHSNSAIQNQHCALRPGNNPHVESCAPNGHGGCRGLDGIRPFLTFPRDKAKTAAQCLNRKGLCFLLAAQHGHIKYHAGVRPDRYFGFIDKYQLNQSILVGCYGVA
jgi:hypothetical protein